MRAAGPLRWLTPPVSSMRCSRWQQRGAGGEAAALAEADQWAACAAAGGCSAAQLAGPLRWLTPLVGGVREQLAALSAALGGVEVRLGAEAP